MFEGEMLNRTIPRNLFQTFCKIIINFQVIIKSLKDSDDKFKSILRALMAKGVVFPGYFRPLHHQQVASHNQAQSAKMALK